VTGVTAPGVIPVNPSLAANVCNPPSLSLSLPLSPHGTLSLSVTFHVNRHGIIVGDGSDSPRCHPRQPLAGSKRVQAVAIFEDKDKAVVVGEQKFLVVGISGLPLEVGAVLQGGLCKWKKTEGEGG